MCKRLSLDARHALVYRVQVRYYTRIIDYTDVHVLGGTAAYPAAALPPLPPPSSSWPGAAAPSTSSAASHDRQQPATRHPLAGPTSAVSEPCIVTTRFVGYQRVWQGTGETFDQVPLFLPDVMLPTHAAYLRLPGGARRACCEAGCEYTGAVHAAAHAVLNVVPRFLTCSHKVGRWAVSGVRAGEPAGRRTRAGAWHDDAFV